MSENEVVEEYNALARAITQIEGATVLLIVYWVGLFILYMYGNLDPLVFKDLMISGTTVGVLLKVYTNKNGN